MSSLAAEQRRLNESLRRMLWKNGDPAGTEVPLRIHERETDAGGGPELHPKFIAYLAAAGVCFCEPREEMIDGVAYMKMRHWCDRRFAKAGAAPPRFMPSQNRNNPRRVKRALRQLRLIAPAEFDIVYLLLARGGEWHATFAKINVERVARGQEPYTMAEFTILAIAGTDKVAVAF